SDFYGDMQQWSFHSQAFFLSRRLHQHHDLLQYNGSVLQDRSVYEDAEIFARYLFRQGQMTERDWGTYHDLYKILYDEEQKLHDTNVGNCQALPQPEKGACLAAEGARHSAEKERLGRAKTDCHNGCHRQGAGTAG
ncbi:MAG: deoxynucleoside kinase, partial [Candidatus Eisenbacteria bacterium]